MNKYGRLLKYLFLEPWSPERTDAQPGKAVPPKKVNVLMPIKPATDQTQESFSVSGLAALCLATRGRLRRGPGLPPAGDQGPGHLGRPECRHPGPAQQDHHRSGGRWWNGGTPLTIRSCLPWWKWPFAPIWMCAWPRPASARPGRPGGWRARPSGPRWMPPSSMNGATVPPQPLAPREAAVAVAGPAALRAASRRSGNYFRPVWMPPGNWIFSGARGATLRPPPPISGPRWRTAATSW